MAESWKDLAERLTDEELSMREIFQLPDNKYRGCPPVEIFDRIFSDFKSVKESYQTERKLGKNGDMAYRAIKHLLSIKRTGMDHKLQEFWMGKAKTHFKRIAYNPVQRGDSKTRQGIRPTPTQLISLSSCGHGVPAPSPLQSSVGLMEERSSTSTHAVEEHTASIDSFTVTSEALWQNSLTLIDKLKLMENNPTLLADFLFSQRTEWLPGVNNFKEALQSGRLTPLKDAKADHWLEGLPELFEVKKESDLETVWGTAMMNISQGSVYEGYKEIDFEPKMLSTFVDGMSMKKPKYALNIPLGKIELHLPERVEKLYKIYQQEGYDSVFSAQANIGTFGAFVDIHDGNTLQMSQQKSTDCVQTGVFLSPVRWITNR
jgi:hypothetical protein